MSRELKAASAVRCLCCKCAARPRLAFFPGLPTLVLSSQISQSGKDLLSFSCFGFFTSYTTKESSWTVVFCAYPQRSKKDHLLLMVVRAGRWNKILFPFNPVTEFGWPKS